MTESDLQEMDEMLYERLKELNFAIDNYRGVKSTSFSFSHWQETEYPDNPEDGVQKKKFLFRLRMNKEGRLESLKVEVSFGYEI